MTTATLLAEARRLVAQGWCQGSFALDALDKPVSALNPDARRFDLEGALAKAGNQRDTAPYYAAYAVLQEILRAQGFRSLGKFSDTKGRTREDVLALLDEALAAVQQVAVAA